MFLHISEHMTKDNERSNRSETLFSYTVALQTCAALSLLNCCYVEILRVSLYLLHK